MPGMLWQAAPVYTHQHVEQGTPRLLAYPTGRGVCFSPAHTQIEHCLKCGTRTDRVSKRTLGSLARGRYGQSVVLTTRVGLRLCEPCEGRWNLAPVVALGSLLLPFALPLGAGLGLGSGNLAFLGFLVAVVLVVFAWRWGLRQSLRVKSIDHDGMVELAGVHPAVVAEICGDEAP